MLSLSPFPRVFLCSVATDMRKGFDALAGMVRAHMQSDPLSGDVYVFVNRSRTHLKLLYFDSDGFVLLYKRLERGTFAVPVSTEAACQLRRNDLVMMLEGLERSQTRRRLRYAAK